jgi:hypothetical protein
MATITITYVAPVATDEALKSQICATFVPTNAAADDTDFAGTWYDTNVYGIGDAMGLDQFMAMQVAHPGLIAALRVAMRAGTYDWTTTDEEVQYMEEFAPALEEQGFTFAGGAASED